MCARGDSGIVLDLLGKNGRTNAERQLSLLVLAAVPGLLSDSTVDAAVTFGESRLGRNNSFFRPGSMSTIVVVDVDELALRLLENALLMLGIRFPSNCLGDEGFGNAGRISSSKGVIGRDK